MIKTPPVPEPDVVTEDEHAAYSPTAVALLIDELVRLRRQLLRSGQWLRKMSRVDAGRQQRGVQKEAATLANEISKVLRGD